MNYKIKKIITNWRILMLLFFLIVSIVVINPSFNTKGVSIINVEKNSSAYLAGIEPPAEGIVPRNREIITHIQNQKINSMSDYDTIIKEIQKMNPGDEIIILTNKNRNGYILKLKPLTVTEVTSEIEYVLENVTEEIYDNQSGKYVNITTEKNISRNKTIEKVIGIQDLGLKVKKVPSSNLRMGLDIEGGTRVILEPERQLNDDEFEMLLSNLKQRLNVYGLADVVVRESKDLLGKRFILIEIAGVNQEEVKELIAKQGKFEAKILNETIFAGGGDIKTVIRSADRSGIDPHRGCGMTPSGTWSCRFYFGIVLSNEAAERQAKATEKLSVITIDENGQPLPKNEQYLSQKLDFYLDNKLTDSLNIGADLKGKAVTDIQISGSGQGRTQLEARQEALKEMKRMQTILITGSLPVKLNIVKTDSISAVLGKEFLNNAFMLGVIAFIAVCIIIYINYKKPLIIVPIAFTILSEIILILGFAAAAGWNLDLAAIAAIIIVIGTGVDHQIIITDETLNKKVEMLSWFDKLKRAFGIILVAGVTSISAMIPLLAAGAGLLKGFALTTIVGIIIGIFIARPAYGQLIEILLNE